MAGLAERYFLTISATLKTMASSKLRRSRPVSLRIFSKAVDQRVAVYEQAAARFGNVQVVLEEALDGEQRLSVERVDALLLEHLAQEGLAQA